MAPVHRPQDMPGRRPNTGILRIFRVNAQLGRARSAGPRTKLGAPREDAVPWPTAVALTRVSWLGSGHVQREHLCLANAGRTASGRTWRAATRRTRRRPNRFPTGSCALRLAARTEWARDLPQTSVTSRGMTLAKCRRHNHRDRRELRGRCSPEPMAGQSPRAEQPRPFPMAALRRYPVDGRMQRVAWLVHQARVRDLFGPHIGGGVLGSPYAERASP